MKIRYGKEKIIEWRSQQANGKEPCMVSSFQSDDLVALGYVAHTS